MPAISLIVAGFNQRDRLAATLASVAGQGPALAECLVYDAGSTDGTFETIRTASARAPRLKPLIGDGKGAAALAKLSFAKVRGAVVGWMPAGACFTDSGACDRFSETFDRRPDIDAIVCFGEAARDAGPIATEALRDRYLQADPPAPPTLFIRRRAIDRLATPTDDILGVFDHVLLMRLSASGATILALAGIVAAPVAAPLPDGRHDREMAEAVRRAYGFLSVEWRERLGSSDNGASSQAPRAEIAKALSLAHCPGGRRSAAAIRAHHAWAGATVIALDDARFVCGLAAIAGSQADHAQPGPILVFDEGLTPLQRGLIHGLRDTFVIDDPIPEGSANPREVRYLEHAQLIGGLSVSLIRPSADPAPDLTGLRFGEHPARPLVVLGNGPSLKGFDFARLAPFDTIGLNVAFRYWDEIGWYPTYYACLDEVVGRSQADDIARLIRNAGRYGIRRFLLRRSLIDELGPLAWNEGVFDFDLLYRRHPAFAREPLTTGSHALIWGAALGYRDIALLGVDGAYVERVAGAEARGGIELEITGEAENPNYFFAGYQRPGDRYNLPNANLGGDLHIDSWRAAALSAAEFGAQVVNANPTSHVDAFPKLAFDEWAAHAGRASPSGAADPLSPADTPHLPFPRDARVQFDGQAFAKALGDIGGGTASIAAYDADDPACQPNALAGSLRVQTATIYQAEFYPRLPGAPRPSFRQLRALGNEPASPGSWGFLIGVSHRPAAATLRQALSSAVDQKPVWPVA